MGVTLVVGVLGTSVVVASVGVGVGSGSGAKQFGSQPCDWLGLGEDGVLRPWPPVYRPDGSLVGGRFKSPQT